MVKIKENIVENVYSTGFKYIDKITANAPQLHRTVLEYFRVFKNIAHNLEPGKMQSNSASHQAPN